MNELLSRMQKVGSIKSASVLDNSPFFNKKDQVPTEIPIINAALSGKLTGGLSSGLTFLAGPSKHFKSLLGLILVKAYMKFYPEAICIFYDSEFGITPEYIDANGIDTARVLHVPIEHLEQLKFDISKRLEEIKRGDKVIFFIDSIGNLASKKEVEDALDGKSVADMTRARVMKSLWRIVTPHLTIKDIPCIAVNHTYQDMCLDGSTLVKTANGNKFIRDIVVDDFVYTNNGLQKVLNTYGPKDLNPVGKRYLELTFDDNSTVKCTHDHKFLMEDGEWVPAEDIKIGQSFY